VAMLRLFAGLRYLYSRPFASTAGRHASAPSREASASGPEYPMIHRKNSIKSPFSFFEANSAMSATVVRNPNHLSP
jgi:hypothetical protein